MRILYGIVGEGMGHATRSRVILDHLLGSGHEILVVVSGRAHAFLNKKFKNRAGITIEEIHGMHFVTTGGELDKSETFLANIEDAPASLRKNFEAYKKVADTFDAQAVVSDFESWAYFYARKQRIPVISIDNMQVMNRCEHDRKITGRSMSFRLAKWAVKSKLPGAYHYLVTSFFFPKVKKKRTTLVPPILRPEVLRAQRMHGRHILVYASTATSTPLVPLLKRMDGYEFRVYGADREGEDGNITFRPFSEQGFINDLRTARAVVGGAGYSLMGEAVHLRVPMLAVPLEGQFEQTLNARYLEQLGYGANAERVDKDTLPAFLKETARYQDALEAYEPRDNSMTFACLDELLRDISVGGGKPDVLDAEAMGKWER